MSRRPIVFVTQETSHNFRLAEEFGELVFLSVDRRDDFHNLKNSEHNSRMVGHLRQGLRDFGPDDYLIPVGSPYIQAAVFALLGLRGVHLLRILRWDNRDLCYIPLEVKLV